MPLSAMSVLELLQDTTPSPPWTVCYSAGQCFMKYMSFTGHACGNTGMKWEYPLSPNWSCPSSELRHAWKSSGYRALPWHQDAELHEVHVPGRQEDKTL